MYLKKKSICLLITLALLLQSCVVYKKTPSTINEAVDSKAKVLVVKTNDEKLKLIKIEKIDGNYFGEIKTRKGIEKIPLSENDIKTIRIKNKSASTLGNVFIVIGSLGVVFIVVAAIELQDFNVGFGEGL
nr:hypothetical protein [uncultured Flavobacterium sp.]